MQILDTLSLFMLQINQQVLYFKFFMDFQNRHGVRFNVGGPADQADLNKQRKDRLRRLALETIDLSKDPYLIKNHLGSFECKLCLTIHVNEDSYLIHTQGKRHSSNLQRRLAKEQRLAIEEKGVQSITQTVLYDRQPVRKQVVKIGRPGYKVTKVRDPTNFKNGLLVQVYYPNVVSKPMIRFMSSFEQRIEPPNKNYQYLLIAGEPYETIGLRIPSGEISKDFWDFYDVDTKIFHFQFFYNKNRV